MKSRIPRDSIHDDVPRWNAEGDPELRRGRQLSKIIGIERRAIARHAGLLCTGVAPEPIGDAEALRRQ
jgi:hypothetical protein